LQILLVLGFRAVVEGVPDVVSGLKMRCALGVLLDEVIVVGFEVGICGWCGESLLDDLRGLG
jgi:hypothetical protein